MRAGLAAAVLVLALVAAGCGGGSSGKSARRKAVRPLHRHLAAFVLGLTAALRALTPVDARLKTALAAVKVYNARVAAVASLARQVDGERARIRKRLG